MRKPRNETDALIRAAADATGCRVSALSKRIGVSVRTVQEWQMQDKCPEPARMLLLMLSSRMVTFAFIDDLSAGWKRYWETTK